MSKRVSTLKGDKFAMAATGEPVPGSVIEFVYIADWLIQRFAPATGGVRSIADFTIRGSEQLPPGRGPDSITEDQYRRQCLKHSDIGFRPATFGVYFQGELIATGAYQPDSTALTACSQTCWSSISSQSIPRR
jgi:hypothetical protein